MKCKICGRENSARASVCANCGATLAKRIVASPVIRFAAGVAGLLAGIVTTGLIWNAELLRYGTTGNSKEGFNVAQVSAWLNVATLLATCVAVVILFQRPIVSKMNGALRVFLLVALFVMLGGMSLCSLLSIPSLFLKA